MILLVITVAAFTITWIAASESWAASGNDISPEVINTHVVFSPSCSKIIYSSNRPGLIRPYLVDMKNPARPKISEINIGEQRNFIAQSLAPDCRTLAMVSDNGGNGLFEIFLYDLQHRTLRKITDNPGVDAGKPTFAPHANLLAYLSNGGLALYDYAAGKQLPMPIGVNQFQSVTWSEDGASLFVEDERFDIWQFDLKSSTFNKVWSGTQPADSTRMPSVHGNHLFLTSDQDADFKQIYSLDLKSGTSKRIFSTPHDQFSPVELDEGHYLFRTDIDANFVAVELVNGKARMRSPATGVVYDFTLAFGRPLLVYSNDQLPTSLYWYNGKALKALVPINFDVKQPAATTIKNSSGVPNFLYLPSKSPRALLIWLHGGPHEQVSPRFNLYFDSLASKNIAVYAINYPGSTGFGKAYAMLDGAQEQALPLQIKAIDQDLLQLTHMMPSLSPQMLVGVSYGSLLAHDLLPAHPEFSYLIDFSGIADTQTAPELRAYPSALFIYGDDDAIAKAPERTALIARYQNHGKANVLILPQEGHYIARRDSIDRILKSMEAFLSTPPASH